MSIQDLKFEHILLVMAVLFLLIGLYNTAMTAIKNHIEAKKRNNAPVDALEEQLQEHARMLDNDKRRFEEYDRRFTEIDERFNEIDAQLIAIKQEISMMLRGVRSLISHELNGNSNDKLREVASTIDEYLIHGIEKK